MLPEERLEKIAQYIRNNNSARVEKLSKIFNASESTIRRDLKKLDEKGIIKRTHGGAVSVSTSTTYEKRAQEKRFIKKKEKDYIGCLAARYIFDGESIILDSGSTTLALSSNLKQKKSITVITYDLKIALETELGANSSIIMTGGKRREGFDVVVGSETEKFIQNLNVNKAFLAADSISLHKGITNATFAEVSIKQQIIKSAKEVILIADHSKFNRIALVKVSALDSIDMIITDPEIDKNVKSELQKADIKVITE